MKDIDKIKEKKENDEVKSILGFVLLFLVIFGIITFAIIKLTSQYFSLKKELAKSKETQLTESPVEDGKKIEYKLEGEKIKVSEIKKDVEEATKEALGNSGATEGDNVTLKSNKQNNKIEKSQDAQVKAKEVNDKISNPQNKVVLQKEKKKTIVEKKAVEKAKQTKKEKIAVKPKQKSTVVKGKYAVQLMAFKNESDAKDAVEKYKKYFDDIFYLKADLGKKGVWYRVRCCKTDSLEKAKEKVNEIYSKLKIKAITVKN